MIKSVHLIVCTEQTTTLNRALHKTAVAACEGAGLHVQTTDIYEFYKEGHPSILPYGIDTSDAEDEAIHEEHEKIQMADLVIVQFPLYLFNIPGLLKNYFDRVWEKDYNQLNHSSKNLPLNGQRFLFSLTTDFTDSEFNANSNIGTLDQSLFPLKTACALFGFESMTPFVCYGVHSKPHEGTEACIKSYHAHIETIIGTSSIALIP